MKISLQFKMGDLNKAGFAPIHLTVSWASLRVRKATGELTRPEWWDKETQEVRNVKGSYSGSINDRLHTLTNTLERADQAAGDRREQFLYHMPPIFPNRINLQSATEVNYWCQTLNCTETRLRNAVLAVGPLAADVRSYLNR